MEKIKRSNNLWTSDSLFLRPALSIPIDKPNIEENSLNGNGERINGHARNHLDRSLNSSSSSGYLNNHLNGSSNSSSTLSNLTSNSNEHNNNLDYKISLNEIQPMLFSDTNDDQQQPSTSSNQQQQNDSNSSSSGNSTELLKAKDESMDDFLSRIDQYIKKSKIKIDSFASTSEIISSKSDDNIFQNLHNYNSKTINYRQNSLRNNDISLGEMRDKHNHENREIIYSLRKLEKEQEEREKYEL